MKKTLFLAMGLSSMVVFAQSEKRVGINTDTPKASLEVKAVEFDGRTQGILFPHISEAEKVKWKDYDAETNKTGLVEGTVIWNTDKKCLDYYDGTKWSCTNNPVIDEIKVPENSSIKLPVGISIGDSKHWIVSVKGRNYRPFNRPTSGATWTEGSTTGNDPLVFIEGEIPASGISVEIPVIVDQTLTLPEYKAYALTPAAAWQDKTAKILELSWASQSLTTSDYKITATIKVYEATAEQKLIQLDLEKGLGNDYNGALLGQFKMPKNKTEETSANYTGIYDVRVISLIPDKKFGEADKKHDFLYKPIVVIGKNGYNKVWLSNNLGAHYTNVESGHFSPTRQAEDYKDFRAYGSLFQWQRSSDGHELVNWTSSTTISSWASSSTILGTTGWVANHSNFITSTTSWVDATTNLTNHTLWQKDGANNPCPTGYHIPTKAEWEAIQTALGGSKNNVEWANSVLKLPSAGNRSYETGVSLNRTTIARYWTSEKEDDDKYSYGWNATSTYSKIITSNRRAGGFSARCIAD